MKNELINKTMIQITLVICIILAVSSCTDVDHTNDFSTSPTLNFIPYTKNAENTKAVFNDNTNSTIGVSTYTISNSSNSVAKEYFSDRLANSGYGWSTSTTRNWPATTCGTNNTEKLAIFAVIPNSISLDDYDYISTNSYEKPSFIYKVNHSAENQEDVLVSYTEADYNTSSNGTIGMKFNSVLSKINIELKGQSLSNLNVTYSVKSIIINGRISDTGRYSFTDGLMTAVNESRYNTFAYPIDNVNEWNAETNPNSWNNRRVSGNDNFSGTGYKTSLMMIPQNLYGKDVTIDVEYSVVINNITIFEGTHSSKINDSWTQGQEYTYNVFLPNNAQEITFSPTVENWTE